MNITQYHSFQSEVFSGTIVFPDKIARCFNQIRHVTRMTNMLSTASHCLTKKNISYLEHLCTHPTPLSTTAPELTALPYIFDYYYGSLVAYTSIAVMLEIAGTGTQYFTFLVPGGESWVCHLAVPPLALLVHS